MKNNLLIRLLVLFIAIFFWVQQGLLRDQQEEVRIPLQFVNIPEDLIVLDLETSELPVILEGRGLYFLFLKMQNPYIEIDGSDFQFGRNDYLVEKSNFRNLDRLEINEEDQDIESLSYVLLDKIIKKSINILITYQNTEEETYFYKYKDIEKDLSVIVKGPQSRINELEFIKTEQVSQQMIENGKLTLNLVNPDNQFLLNNQSITLNLLHERQVNKTFSLIPITYPVDYDLTIIPQKVSIMIRGPQNIINEIDKAEIEAYLETKDLNRIKLGKEMQLGVNFNLPNGTKLIEFTPSKVQVKRNG